MNSETPISDVLAENSEIINMPIKKVVKKSLSPKKRKKTIPKTFKSAFDILKNNANELQQQSEPDIDNLMITVEESITAYKVCKDRIDAVQSALDEAFATEDNIAQDNNNQTSSSDNSKSTDNI